MNQNSFENASVLVVDDNPLILNVLKSLFNSANYQVYTSCNGEEAKETLKNKNVDLIICDVMMPEMNGYALHDFVREKPEFAHIPFVFLTALDSPNEKQEGQALGADDYLVKPFDPEELLAVVSGKLKRSKGIKSFSEQQYDSYRKKVIHTLSHEFRTPLVAINTGTELLLEQQAQFDKERMQNLLLAIQRGGQRLEKLVSDFMVLQQIEAGVAERLFNNKHAIKDLFTLLQQYLEVASHRIKQAGFKFESYIFNHSVKVDVYEQQIIEILERLISNSLKFHSEQKEIYISTFPLGDEIAIEIKDKGIGIDPIRLKEAIDVFGQIDRDKLEQQGGGLGLAIANRFASINKGRLEFDNLPEGGTVARLILPIVD
jgi:signal transduction histidine kinase